MNILKDYKFENNEENIININENIDLKQVIGTILIRDNDSNKINRKLSLNILSCWPSKNSCPIELDSDLEYNDFDDKNSIGTTNYLIRISRKLDSEIGDDRYTIILEASKFIMNILLNSKKRNIFHIQKILVNHHYLVKVV